MSACPVNHHATDLSALSVAELKKRIHEQGATTTDCFERSDLEAKLRSVTTETATSKNTTTTTTTTTQDNRNGEKEESADQKQPQQAEKKKYYRAVCGHTTVQGRLDWLGAHGIKADKADTISNSLVADLDTQKPLYYWQLFSLLGQDRIHAMVKTFYKHVYADKEAPWFREAFEAVSTMEHHITTQTQFWCDAMGGGKYYHGGDYRLKFHHTNNADAVMNAKGAQRWMYHMRRAVAENEQNPKASFAKVDPRILPCLKDFLHTKVMKYAQQHRWDFDNSDFDKFPQ